VLRVPVDGGSDFLAQELVLDPALPAGRDHALEVADHELVQEHAERVDVGLQRDRLPLEDLGLAYQQRVRALGEAAGQREDSPPQLLSLFPGRRGDPRCHFPRP
jgi:hypothetical protein